MANQVALFSLFFDEQATPEIFTLSYTTLFRSDREVASGAGRLGGDVVFELCPGVLQRRLARDVKDALQEDRKSTRLNSSHVSISYAVFCLKKKKHSCRI